MPGDRSWNAKKANRMERRVKQEVVTTGGPGDGDRHVYRFHEASEWANTIRLIREKFALRRDDSHLDIICRNEAEEDIVLHFMMRDVYLIGFTLGDVAYEFGLHRAEAVHKLPASIFLGYGCGYGDMDAGNMTSINIGYWSFTQALREIINGSGLVGDLRDKWKEHIRTLIPTVLVMLPECVRFKWHYQAVRRLMTGELNQGAPSTVNDWMERGIKNWKRASVVAFEKERTNREDPPPLGEIHAYVLTDMQKALQDWVWATDLLVVHCLLERQPRHVLKDGLGWNGKQMVPHLLVLWNNKEVDWQTKKDMNLDFPNFKTKVITFPTPPQRPA